MSLTSWQSAFVFFIESPSENDLLDGRTQGKTLCSSLELAEIPCAYNLTISKKMFDIAITDKLIEAAILRKMAPILHINLHGNTSGIGFANGDFVSWAELGERLRPLNEALSGELLLCLSSCLGASGMIMAFNSIKPAPMHTMIASKRDLTWQEATVGFVTFYHHLLHLKSDVSSALQAMKAASANTDFVANSSQEIQRLFSIFDSKPIEWKEQLIHQMKRLQKAGPPI